MKRLLFFLLTAHMLQGTLPSLQKYAASLPEVPRLEYDTFALNPDYAVWQRERGPSWFTRMLTSLGIYRPAWSPQQFVALLQDLQERQQTTYEHAVVMRPLPETKMIIVGPLYGAFHSLLRILDELVVQDMLSPDFSLKHEHTYLVFTGDVINGSPYNLETLSVVLELMKMNPRRVIYLAGEFEKGDTWRGLGLQTDLEERVKDPRSETWLSQFFATLPQALFLTDGTATMVIGNNVPLDCLVHAVRAGDVRTCAIDGKTTPTTPGALITNEKRLISFAHHGGLAVAPSQFGALTWAVFSGPNGVYRKFYDFSYDAFTVLTIGTSLAHSVISLYNQEVSQTPGFQQVARFAALSGKELRSGTLKTTNPFILSSEARQQLVTCDESADLSFVEQDQTDVKKTVYIGCTLDLSKGAAPLGRRLRDGISLRINQANQQGGIKGRPIKMVFMDDGYSPAQARENVETFIKRYESPLFLCNLGSPTTEIYTDLMEKEKIFVFFPSTGAPVFRTPAMKGVVHWRASFPSEAKALTRFVNHQYGVDKFAFLYQNDSFGKGALSGAKEVNIKEVSVGYERNVTSFSQQITKIREAGVEGLGFLSTSAAAIEFIRQAGVEFFIGKRLFGLSDLAEASFKKFAALRGLDFTIAQFVPNPQTSTIALAQDFRDILRQQGGAEGDVFMFEGYISACLFLYILEKAETYTPQGINKVLKGIKNEEYKGFKLSFNPQTRELARLLWIDTGAPEWLAQELA